MADEKAARRSPLERAHERLERAVARLEKAVQSRPRPGSGNGELAHELETVRSQNAALKEINATVSGRLDATISRLRHILEE